MKPISLKKDIQQIIENLKPTDSIEDQLKYYDKIVDDLYSIAGKITAKINKILNDLEKKNVKCPHCKKYIDTNFLDTLPYDIITRQCDKEIDNGPLDAPTREQFFLDFYVKKCPYCNKKMYSTTINFKNDYGILKKPYLYI